MVRQGVAPWGVWSSTVGVWYSLGLTRVEKDVIGWGVLLCISEVVALVLCKPSPKNQVSIGMTTFLFYITIVLLLALASYLKNQLRK